MITFLSALLIAIIGAFAGAAFRPLLENYIATRTHRIEINTPPELQSGIKLPYGMKIQWEGEVLERFEERAFFVTNRTGKTIRDVDIIVESTPDQEIDRSEIPYIYDIIAEAILPNKLTVEDIEGNGLSKRIKIEHLEREKSVGARIVSTLLHSPTFRAPSDYEVEVVCKPVIKEAVNRGRASVEALISVLGLSLGLVAVAAATPEVQETLTRLADKILK